MLIVGIVTGLFIVLFLIDLLREGGVFAQEPAASGRSRASA